MKMEMLSVDLVIHDVMKDMMVRNGLSFVIPVIVIVVS